jgi:hypothetical protein
VLFTNRNLEWINQIRLNTKFKKQKEPFEMMEKDLKKLKVYLEEKLKDSYDNQNGK